MTMPTLMASTQKKELQTALKKAYSTLSQALMMYENDNGWPVTSKLEVGQLKPILMKYINTAKDCGIGTEGDKACMPNKAYVSNPDDYKDIYKTFNGKNNINYALFDDGQFVMNDNMFVMIENGYQSRYPDATVARVWISVDVNGFNKKPNRFGQDLFMFQIDDKGALLPMGAEGTEYYSENDAYCSSVSLSSLNGAGCTAKALNDEGFWKGMP